MCNSNTSMFEVLFFFSLTIPHGTPQQFVNHAFFCLSYFVHLKKIQPIVRSNYLVWCFLRYSLVDLYEITRTRRELTLVVLIIANMQEFCMSSQLLDTILTLIHTHCEPLPSCRQGLRDHLAWFDLHSVICLGIVRTCPYKKIIKQRIYKGLCWY